MMTSHSGHVSVERHREIGACCEVRGVSHFWAEPGEHSSELEVAPCPKRHPQKDGASRITPPLYRWRADTQMAVAEKTQTIAYKKFMVKQDLECGSSKSYAGTAGGVGEGGGSRERGLSGAGKCLKVTPEDETKSAVGRD